MYEMPALLDTATALLAVGLLFWARFALALRRLRRAQGGAAGSPRDLWGAARANRFGAPQEPERRHALRQFWVGAACLAAASLLYGWLAARALGLGVAAMALQP